MPRLADSVRTALLLAVLVANGAFAAGTTSRAGSGAEAAPVALNAGERRSGDLVTLGRDVEITGELEGALVTVGGSARLGGHVTGDVILLGTAATVGPGARVDGDLLSVGGSLRFEGGATPGDVRGRLVTVAALEAAFLAELRTSPLHAASVSPLLLSFRLLLLAGWLAVGLALLFLGPRRLATAARVEPRRLPMSAALGLSAFLTAVLLSAFLLAFVPAKPAFLAVALLLGALLAAKAFGLAVLFLVLGRRLARNAARGAWTWGDPAALALGLLALGLVSLLPAAGALVWTAASLAGIGLALETRFGRPGLTPAAGAA